MLKTSRILTSKKMTILVGASGSGKSTWMKTHEVNPHNVVSADHFFNQPDGSYAFDPSKLKDAHGASQSSAEALCAAGEDVYVDNTNTQAWERKPYIDLAQRYGYDVEIVVLDGRFQNTHGVPEEAVERMRKRIDMEPGTHHFPYRPSDV